MIEQTVEKLKEMRLTGFVEALREQHETTQYQNLAFDERFAFIVDKEYFNRQTRKLNRAIKRAQLKQQATIEDVDFEAPRKLKRAQFLELATSNWIRKHHNLIIVGPTGIGKSFLACALADQACKSALQARYYRTNAFLSELLLAKADGSYPKLVMQLAKTHLLIIDEWLREPLSHSQAREILDILDDRYRKASTIFCSQLAVKDWYARIEDPTMADAILDRIVHDSLRLELDGKSMREKTSEIVNPGSSLRSDK
jgi:DNA replication protein DnaC